MNLAASANLKRPFDGNASAGYAMAALLVAMSVMAVLMTVAMPTWKHALQREKEEELVFRGNQYARAINQYQRRNANASPLTLDLLLEQRLLRKKFKDPFSPDKDGEFQLLYLNNESPAGGAGAGTGTAGQGGAGSALGTKPAGGIMGVSSKSTAESIRVFNGKNHYNEWQFIALQQSAQAGAGALQGTGLGQGRGQGQGRGDGRGQGPGGIQPPPRGRGDGSQPPPPGQGRGPQMPGQ